jgi:hypothetical protein
MGWSPIFTQDDAYIVQHSVENIINLSNEKIFIDSNSNSGLTSLLHVSLISLLSLFINIGWSQFIIASLAYTAFLILVFYYSEKVNRNTWVSSAITIVAALSGSLVIQTYNGLETILVVFCVLLILYVFRDGTPKNKLYFILLPIIPFIRPELAFLSFIILFRAFFSIKKYGNISELKKIIMILAISSIVLVLYSILMTESIIPNTAGAKKYFFIEACRNSNEKFSLIINGIREFIISLNYLSLGFLFILFSRYKFVFISFAAIFYSLYYFELPGGVYHNIFRYQYVFYSFAVVGLIEFLALDKIKIHSVCIAFFIFLPSILSINKQVDHFKAILEFTKNELFVVGAWVRDNIDKNEVILIHDAGVISTVARNRLVDLVGLKTNTSVEINKDKKWSQCENSPEAIDTIASKYNIKYFIVLDHWDNLFQLTNALKHTNWSVQRVDNERGDTPYKVYKISK